MIRIGKPILLLSTAFLIYTESGTRILAAQLPPKQAPAQQQSVITQQCNQCAKDIADLINSKVKAISEDTIEIITGQRGDPQEKEKIEEFRQVCISTAKDHILKNIGAKLEKKFEYLDQPVPDEKNVQAIITEACDKMKSTVDSLIHSVIVAYKDKSNPIAKPKSQQAQGGAVQPQSSPFEVKLKKHAAQAHAPNLTPTQKLEMDLVTIQPQNDSEVAKKAADKLRLEKIKEYLDKAKGKDFAKHFTDAELLAFQLHVLEDLNPKDLEDKIEGYHGRKFSEKTLEFIKDIRFSKDPGTRSTSEALTAQEVRSERPENLLRNILQMTEMRVKELKAGNHLK